VVIATTKGRGKKRRKMGRRTCFLIISKLSALHITSWFVFGVLFLRDSMRVLFVYFDRVLFFLLRILILGLVAAKGNVFTFLVC
jgi:hypothetical protein